MISDEEIDLLSSEAPAAPDLDDYMAFARKIEKLVIEKLSANVAELYQVLGALDAPENVLDQALALAQGEKLPHETILPFIKEPTC